MSTTDYFRARRARKVAEARQHGRCSKCYKRECQPGRVTCEVCAADSRSRSGLNYLGRKNEGKCIDCRERDRSGGRMRCEPCLGRAAATAREHNRKLRLKIMSHYSGGAPFCRCCGESIPVYLTIDHVDDDGADHRRRVMGKNKGSGTTMIYRRVIRDGFRERLQVLCWNCQWAKRLNGGICPRTGKDLRRPPTPEELAEMQGGIGG